MENNVYYINYQSKKNGPKLGEWKMFYVDSAEHYLNIDHSIEAICALIPIQIQRRDFPQAQLHLDYVYNESQNLLLINPLSQRGLELQSFCQFHNAVKGMKARPGGYLSATAAEINTLTTIANSERNVSINARAVLDFINGVYRYDPADPIDNSVQPRMAENILKLEPTKPELLVYPNPANTQVTIETGNLSAEGEHTLMLLDVTGKVLQQKQISQTLYTAQFDITNYAEGIYFIQLNGDSKILATQKLIVIKQ